MQTLEAGVFVRRDLVELQRFLTSEKYQTLLIVHAHDFIREHEGPLGVALGLAVWTGGAINRRKQRQKWHLVVLHLDSDHAALF